jgi:hypothetical protein
MPPTWNDGMLESWNNGQKRLTSVFGSRLLGSLFDVEKRFKAQDTVSWDTPCFITKAALATDSFKRVEHDGYPGRNKAAAIEASLPAFSNRC